MFVQIEENVFINTNHVVKAWLSEGDHQLQDTQEWVHNAGAKSFTHASNKVVCFKMIDGSIEVSAGIEESGSSLYTNAWEAINGGLKFE